MGYMVTTNVAIPIDLHKALRVRAEEEQRPVSWVLARILSEALNVAPAGDAEAVRRSL